MYIKVKVFPEAREEKFIKESEDTFSIHVKEPPRGGSANKRIVKLIAEYFNSPVRIVSGHHSRRKIFSVSCD